MGAAVAGAADHPARRDGGATIALSGPTAPGLFDDVDPARAAKDRLPSVRETIPVIMGAQVNWTVVPCPHPDWAALVHPDLDADAAYTRLWDEIAHVCRLDEPDPAAAWRARGAELAAAADRLNARRLDALHFWGPAPTSGWACCRSRAGPAAATARDGLPPTCRTSRRGECSRPPTRRGRRGTSPPPSRSRWAALIIRGLRVRFEGGRAVEIDADSGAEALRGRAAVDDGAARLGEVALVDGSGRIGPLGVTFFDTLLGRERREPHRHRRRLPEGHRRARPRRRHQRLRIHIDFMIGGPR